MRAANFHVVRVVISRRPAAAAKLNSERDCSRSTCGFGYQSRGAELGHLEQPVLDLYKATAVGNAEVGHPPRIRPMRCLALDARLQCI